MQRVPDVDAPNAARMYDYFLGGVANFAADRDAAEQALAITPEIGEFARANRAFLFRAVRLLCERGVDQFLDLGSGIPTVGNVHEIVHRQNPHARVAYVDREPVAVAHAEILLRDHARVTVSQADIRHPHEVLATPGVAGLLDFTRPVAVLAVAILHFVADEHDPAGLVAAYRDACAPGSYLAVSHASPLSMTPDEVRRGQQLYRTTSTPHLSLVRRGHPTPARLSAPRPRSRPTRPMASRHHRRERPQRQRLRRTGLPALGCVSNVLVVALLRPRRIQNHVRLDSRRHRLWMHRLVSGAEKSDT